MHVCHGTTFFIEAKRRWSMLQWSGLAYRQKRSLIDNHHTQGTEVWVRWWQRVEWTPAKQTRSLCTFRLWWPCSGGLASRHRSIAISRASLSAFFIAFCAPAGLVSSTWCSSCCACTAPCANGSVSAYNSSMTIWRSAMPSSPQSCRIC